MPTYNRLFLSTVVCKVFPLTVPVPHYPLSADTETCTFGLNYEMWVEKKYPRLKKLAYNQEIKCLVSLDDQIRMIAVER